MRLIWAVCLNARVCGWLATLLSLPMLVIISLFSSFPPSGFAEIGIFHGTSPASPLYLSEVIQSWDSLREKSLPGFREFVNPWVLVSQSYPTLCDPMNCSLPDSSVLGILQERILQWVAIPFCRGSSRPRDWTGITWVSCIAGRFFTTWASKEALKLQANMFTYFSEKKID